jgi:sugar transferase (PEP-CTERM/EpsH1 system associated)
MRILWLKSDLLIPLDKGGKLRTWHLMRHLARRHHVTYLAFADRSELSEDGTLRAPIADGMREVCAELVTVPHESHPKRSTAFYLEAAAHVVRRLPYAVGKYRSAAYRGEVQRLLEERSFDLVVCDFLVPAVNLPRTLPCPAVLFTHNVEAEIWRRHAETQPNPIARALYGLQHRRMLRFERECLARFDGVLAVSDADRETFARLYPGAIRRDVHVVPTGVDTAFFEPAPERASATGLVFTGSMDWLPNEDAMLHFCRDILPFVRADEPTAGLAIVGRSPTPAVASLGGQDGIVVTGRVDDIRPHVRDAAVYVVPLRIGGGTRLKIFEAMAAGKAVVSTTIGAEGLPAEPGRHLLIADGAEAFAQAVLRVVREPALRRSLEHEARTLVARHYDWAVAAAQLEASLESADRPVFTPDPSLRRRPAAAVRSIS